MQDTKEQVLIGLWSRDLCNAMASRVHANVDQLLHDMIEFERMNSQRAERIRGSREEKNEARRFTKNSTDQLKTEDTPSTSTTTKNNDKRPPIRNANGEPKCYNCNKYGHISKNCPEPPKIETCSKCNEQGHTQRHCPNVKSPPKKDINQVSNENVDHTIQKYIKVALVDNNKLIALIDPGAAECTTKSSLISKLGLEFHEEQIILKSFGPQHFVTNCPGFAFASVSLDGIVVPSVRLIVVPD